MPGIDSAAIVTGEDRVLRADTNVFGFGKTVVFSSFVVELVVLLNHVPRFDQQGAEFNQLIAGFCPCIRALPSLNQAACAPVISAQAVESRATANHD
jgi:hypothetical protein